MENNSHTNEGVKHAPSENIDDYPLDTLTPGVLRNIKNEDLEDEGKIFKRSLPEQFSIQVELSLRILYGTHPQYFSEDPASGELYDHFHQLSRFPQGMDETMESQFYEQLDDLDSARLNIDKHADYESEQFKLYEQKAEEFRDNPLTLQNMFEFTSLRSNSRIPGIIRPYMESLSEKYPLVRLTIALVDLLQDRRDENHEDIYQQPDINQLFPSVTAFHPFELQNFWLIRVLVHLKNNELKEAISYYDLVAHNNVFSWSIIPVQKKLSDYIGKIIDNRNR
jgi:hypothetical protein